MYGCYKQSKKKSKTRPQVDSNPCSADLEATDPFYFVVIIYRFRETDFQKSMTTDNSGSSGGST